MPEIPLLSQYISIRSRFMRSVHLERDFKTRGANEYYLTETAFGAMKALEAALTNPVQRAITLTGPYGTGKSALCIHLAQMLGSGSEGLIAINQLAKSDANLSQAFAKCRLIPILIVGARQSMAKALVQGLKKSLEAGGFTKLSAALSADCRAVLEAPDPSPHAVAELYTYVAQKACLEGSQGLLLIIDEMGKFFEYAALNPKQGDIFLLQELAEAAARSGNQPLIVLGVLHQNLDAYAQRLGRTYQSEWAKVSERFRQINFFPSDLERLEMVGRALKQDKTLKLAAGFSRLTQLCLEQGLVSSVVKESFQEKARSAYPLHPLCLLALPSLFRRMGQSHRSLFSFLSGEEPHAMGRFLRETPYNADNPPLFMLHSLFDYAEETLAGSWSASLMARAWAETVEIIENTEGLSVRAQQVLKCIGLLGILREPKLTATSEVLEIAVSDCVSDCPDIDGILEELKNKRCIVFSRTRNCYRLFEGGDVDVEAELESAKIGLSSHLSLQVASEICPPPRLIARRHSYRTGAVRTVQTLFCNGDKLEKTVAEAGDRLTLIYCLTSNIEESVNTEEFLQSVQKSNVLVSLAPESSALREAAADVIAAHKVQEECRALDHDRAARRELDFQRGEAETLFQREWDRLFSVAGSGEAAWHYKGEPKEFESAKQFNVFLSTMADKTYHASPWLKNELINRHALSAAAASGRRSLIEGMILHAEEPHLGIKGAPPELSMYECLLRATQIHRESETGQWGWCAPSADSPGNLLSVWQEMERHLFTEPPTAQPLTKLYATLKEPPYGITEGVLPVLLCAFMQVYAFETTLYKDGTFLPEPKVPDWEVLLRRPDLFAVAGCRVIGERALVVQRLAQGLKTEPAVIPVVRALLRMVRSLPEFAWKTKQLPSEVLNLRVAIDKAKSPERLLFYELPTALGVTLLAEEEIGANNGGFCKSPCFLC